MGEVDSRATLCSCGHSCSCSAIRLVEGFERQGASPVLRGGDYPNPGFENDRWLERVRALCPDMDDLYKDRY